MNDSESTRPDDLEGNSGAGVADAVTTRLRFRGHDPTPEITGRWQKWCLRYSQSGPVDELVIIRHTVSLVRR